MLQLTYDFSIKTKPSEGPGRILLTFPNSYISPNAEKHKTQGCSRILQTPQIHADAFYS